MSEIAKDPNLNLSASYWIAKGEARQTTKENNLGKRYAIGDEFILSERWTERMDEVRIVEILPSGKFFKVDKSNKTFSVKTLTEFGKGGRRNVWQRTEYLTPQRNIK